MKKQELISSLQQYPANSFLPIKEVIKMVKSLNVESVTAEQVQTVTESVLSEIIKDGAIKKMVRQVIDKPAVQFPFKKFLRRGDVKEIAKIAKTHNTYVSAILMGRKPGPHIVAIAERFVKEKYGKTS